MSPSYESQARLEFMNGSVKPVSRTSQLRDSISQWQVSCQIKECQLPSLVKSLRRDNSKRSLVFTGWDHMIKKDQIISSADSRKPTLLDVRRKSMNVDVKILLPYMRDENQASTMGSPRKANDVTPQVIGHHKYALQTASAPAICTWLLNALCALFKDF